MIVANKNKIVKLAENLTADEQTSGRSLWADARTRFMRNKAAITSLVILVLIVLFSFVGPYFAVWTYEQIDWNTMGSAATLGMPSIETGHYFGTDDLGRDLYSRVIQGTQISLMVGIVGATIAVVVGTLYGATSGYIGGRTDQIMMRIVDILMAIPFMFVLILLLVVFGRSIIMLFVGIGLLSWLDMSRIVRGQTLNLKNKEFIEAAQATGVSDYKIIMRHIVPNLLGIVAVYATLLVPGIIIAESFISFLGLGVQEPKTSWGALISEGAGTINYDTEWQLLVPLSFFVVTLFCIYFIGDGLRDALDPKER
ncbi:MAG: ABC transporter permease subunit [SAR324 cluster bacterium]|jgi:oligopeptide transport system permease protein|nr:ABC transporter permease subunit [SAR324 cluster bacterium]